MNPIIVIGKVVYARVLVEEKQKPLISPQQMIKFEDESRESIIN